MNKLGALIALCAFLDACALAHAPHSSQNAGGKGEGEGEGAVGGEGEGEGAVGGEGEGGLGGEGEGVAGGEGEGGVGGEGEGGVGEGEGEGTVSTDLGPYDHDGPGTFTTLAVGLQNGSSSFTEHVFIPDSPGPHPVVLLRSGTDQHFDAYNPYSQRLASYGIVVLARDDPGVLTHTQVVVADMKFVIQQWLPAQNVDSTSLLFGKLDLARVGVTGHSRGGKAALLAAEEMPNDVQAYFAIDAVDVNFIDDGVYGITTIADLTIPTTFFTAQIAGNCNPANASGQVYFNSAPSPSVLVIAVGAGHFECEDLSHALFQSACSEPGTADPLVVLGLGVRYATAYFARELLDDTSVGAGFEGAGAAADVAANRTQITTK
jgi:hypothetical protein